MTKGYTAIGSVFATFIMAMRGKTFDLLWVYANVQKIIVGRILLVAVLLPALSSEFEGNVYTTVEADDGGTRVIALDPYVFIRTIHKVQCKVTKTTLCGLVTWRRLLKEE